MKENNLYARELNLSEDNKTYSVVYSQTKHNSFVRASGRVIKTLDEIVPNKIENFEIINQNAGLNLNKITVNRRILRNLKKRIYINYQYVTQR